MECGEDTWQVSQNPSKNKIYAGTLKKEAYQK